MQPGSLHGFNGIAIIFSGWLLIKDDFWGTSLVVQWLRTLPIRGMKVQSLVGELRSHMPWGN